MRSRSDFQSLRIESICKRLPRVILSVLVSLVSDGQALDDLHPRRLRSKQSMATQLRHRHVQHVVARAVFLDLHQLQPIPAREPHGRRPFDAPALDILALDNGVSDVLVVADLTVGILLNVDRAVTIGPFFVLVRSSAVRGQTLAATDRPIGVVGSGSVDHV